MTPFRFWRISVRLAWRDLRSAPGRPVFIVLAMAVSIAGIGGVHGAANAAREALRGDSWAWLAGDLCADTRDPIGEDQVAALDRMKTEGIDWTVMTTALTMAGSDQSPDPGVMSIKAIDPGVYPFYGVLTLDPPGTLADALHSDTVVVSAEVLDRLEVRRGDIILIAAQPFRVSASIQSEPHRFSSQVGIGMRCILSREGLERTGIENAGNAVKNRILLRLKNESVSNSSRRRLQELFPAANLRDYHGAHREETAVTETVITSVSVTAFLALMLGAIGVAISVRQYAEESMPALAVMRMLGARTTQMATVFFLQIGWMMAAAVAIGVPLGFAVRVSILSLAGRYLALPSVMSWHASAILESAGAGLAAMAPVPVQPALLIRNLRPAIVLRRTMWGSGAEEIPASAPNATRSLVGWIAAAVALPASAALGCQMLQSARSALLLLAALGVVVGIASILAGGALRLMRRWTLRHGMLNHRILRQGIVSLYRPGYRSRTLIVVLSTVLTMIITTFEASAAVVRAIFDSQPYDLSSLFITGFRDSHRDRVLTFVERLPGVQGVDMMTQAKLQLRSVNGPPIERPLNRPGTAALMNLNPDGACNPGYTLHMDGERAGCVETAVTRELAGSRSGTDMRTKLLEASEGVNALSADQWNYHCASVTGVEQTVNVFFPPSNRAQTMTVDYYLRQRANAVTKQAWSYTVICDKTLAAEAGSARLILEDHLARELGAGVGSRLEFESQNGIIEAAVIAIRKLTPFESLWSSIKLDCGALDESSLTHQGVVKVVPGQTEAVRLAIRAKYPALAVVSADDVSQSVMAVGRDAMTLTRVVAWFAIGAGLSVLIAIVAASRTARLREIGILSALGARRATVLKLYTVEFAVVGVLSGVIAGVLAGGFTLAVLDVVLHRAHWALEWTTIGGAIVISAAATVCAGWLPAYGLLRRKPMEILRA